MCQCLNVVGLRMPLLCCVTAGSSRGRMSRGRGAVARYHTALRHGGDRGLGTGPAEPYDPAAISATSPDQTEQLSDMVDELTEDDVGGRQSKVGGGARRKAGSGRIGFQYPDVFGRRRTRGGAAGAGRRRAITSGRINFRHRTPLAQPDDVTSGDIDNGPEASLNTVQCRTIHFSLYASGIISRRSRQRERLSASVLSICSSVCLSVCLSVRLSVAKMQKRRFSQKLSNLELWCLY